MTKQHSVTIVNTIISQHHVCKFKARPDLFFVESAFFFYREFGVLPQSKTIITGFMHNLERNEQKKTHLD